MNLAALGFDGWFQERAGDAPRPGARIARVTAVDRGAFLVRTGDEEIAAEPAGRLRFAASSAGDLPCVGDWAWVQWPSSGGPAVINRVLPRRTFLRRKRPGKSTDSQMIAANIDVAFIVQGCGYDFNIHRLERYLVVVNDGRIEPRIVLTKTDLVTGEELTRMIAEVRAAGISTPVIGVSNTTGAGLDEFRSQLAPGRTHCLLGSSGVGKTTLINRLVGSDALETRPVSGTGEGVHATTRRQLLILEGGAMLVDTPGMRELGVLGRREGLHATFTDIGDHAAQCRFHDCTHTREAGCAVLAARERGELGEDRYQAYLKLRKEADFQDLSHVEKRRRDKAFGKMVKSAMKRHRK